MTKRFKITKDRRPAKPPQFIAPVMKLSYGNGNSCDLARTDVEVVSAAIDTCIPEDDIADQVRAALAHPLDYPDLSSASVPGDNAVIAVEYGVPHGDKVIEGTLESLRQTGIDNCSITILFSPEFTNSSGDVQRLRDQFGNEVPTIIHDAEEDENLALLGVTVAGRPLRLNRLLCDADLVIPIGATKSSDLSWSNNAFFPIFSDLETLRRFRSPTSHENAASRQKLESEIGECFWRLGANLVVQVVPGPRGEVAAVRCGTYAGVSTAARLTYNQVWSADVERRADLVVATIVGDSSQQTWQNVSRALAAAERLLEPGGAIAVCTELSSRPGPSGKLLRNAADLQTVERRVLKEEFADSLAALTLCRSLQRGTVYLKSHLNPSLVEGLGLAPIQSDDEIQRLSQTYRRCLILEEAQHLEPKWVDGS